MSNVSIYVVVSIYVTITTTTIWYIAIENILFFLLAKRKQAMLLHR